MVPGIRIISSAESRKYYKYTAQTKRAKLRKYLPGTFQQLVPAGTAVYNQQDRGGRATAGERRRASDVARGRRRASDEGGSRPHITERAAARPSFHAPCPPHLAAAPYYTYTGVDAPDTILLLVVVRWHR